MPELPEVETVKRQLQKSLIGRRIKAVLVYTDKMIKVGAGRISNIKIGHSAASKKFISLLRGKEILSLDRRAKFLLIRLSGGLNLMIHLRMSGQLIFVAQQNQKLPLKLSLARTAIAQTLPTKHSHVQFDFSGNKGSSAGTLFYNDTRQFGHIRLVTDAELDEVWVDHNLGPEPLTLTLEEFQKIVTAHGKKRAKDFLLDQQVIAGIGNIYADESLFLSKIHPLRKVGTLKPIQIKELLNAVQGVLRAAIRSGGSSIEYFLMTNGSAGRFSDRHLVYGKSGKKCPRCGQFLKSRKIGSRTAVFCTNCQK